MLQIPLLLMKSLNKTETPSFRKIGFDISCKLSLIETICKKCQILKNKKHITNLLSTDSVKIESGKG